MKIGVSILGVLLGIYISIIGITGFAFGGFLLAALFGVPLTVAGVRTIERYW